MRGAKHYRMSLMSFFSLIVKTLLSSALVFTSVLAAPVPELEELLNAPLKQAPQRLSLSSRTALSSDKATGSVYVVTASDIKALQLNNLASILKLFPGLHIIEDPIFTYLISRSIGQPGDYNSRLLFLLDGNRINENTSGAGLLGDEFFLDTQWIERVEYHPGAPSASYGANAMLGVVHIISKAAVTKNSILVSPTISNQHLRQLNITANGSYGEVSGWLGMSITDTKLDPIIALNPQQFPSNTMLTQQIKKISGKLNYQNSELIFSQVQRDSLLPMTLPDTVTAPAFRNVRNSVSLLGVKHSHNFSPTITGYLNLATLQQNYQYEESILLLPNTLLPAFFHLKGNWSVLDSRIAWQTNARLHWQLGIDLQRDHKISQRDELPDFDFIQELTGENFQRGLYIENQWQMTRSLTLNSSLRYDEDQHKLAHWSPALAILWQYSPELLVKLRHSKAVRAPSFVERIYNESVSFPLPKTESVRATELSIDTQLSQGWRWYNSLYYNELNNLIFNPLYEIINVNALPVRTYGIETGFDIRWQQWRSQFSYSFQHGKVVGGQLTNAPKHLGKMQLYYQFNSSLSANWQLYAVSSRPYGPLVLPGYVMQNLGLSWSIKPEWSVNLNIKNLTNTRSIEIPQRDLTKFPLPTRTLELRVDWSWQ